MIWGRTGIGDHSQGLCAVSSTWGPVQSRGDSHWRLQAWEGTRGPENSPSSICLCHCVGAGGCYPVARCWAGPSLQCANGAGDLAEPVLLDLEGREACPDWNHGLAIPGCMTWGKTLNFSLSLSFIICKMGLAAAAW